VSLRTWERFAFARFPVDPTPRKPVRPARPRAALALAVGVLTAAGLAVGTYAEGAAASPFEATWQASDGTSFALYRPRFVPAAELLADAQAFGLAPLGVGMDLGFERTRGRLLVSGAADRLRVAAEALGYLDVPTPQVLVEVSIVETLNRCRRDTGGLLRFDRTATGPDTFFRTFRYDFEPSSWLRHELVGGRPFEGADVRGGGTDLSGGLAGTVDAVLRGLAHDGQADVLARPCLVCSLGVPAKMSSTLSLPATLFFRQGTSVQRSRVDERAGISLEVTAEAVGRDAARLKVHPWIRRVEEASSPTGPESYPVLGSREMTTTVTVADGQTVLVAALEGRRSVRDRRGYPALDLLPALDGLLAAHTTDRETTDVHVLLRARILQPGREPPAVVPPGEAGRLDARRRALAP